MTFSQMVAWVAARWYLKRPELAERIQERYWSPWTIGSVLLNLLLFHLRSTRSHRVTGISLEPTNVCNLRCSVCPYDKEMTREKGYMKMDLVRKILRENPWVESYSIPLLGEPFLYKKLPEMVSLIKEAGKKVHIYTNGTVMKNDVFAQIFTAGLDNLIFSMDGVDQAYTSVRGYPYQHLEANVLKTIELRNLLNAPTRVKLNAVISEKTQGNVENIVKRWGMIVDSIEFTAFQYTVPNNGGQDRCKELWRGSLIVLWDGRVIPCCYDVNASMCIGNAFEESLAQMWNGVKMRELRRKMLSEPRRGLCAQCAYYRFDFDDLISPI